MDPRKTILIVEDEEGTRKILSNTLAAEGFAVLDAADGEAGLRMALERHPDLILLDIMLPGMDGLTLLEKLRSDPWGATAPVIIITNLSADDKVTQRIMKTEPAYYLMKPNWKLADVVEKAKEVLSGQRVK